MCMPVRLQEGRKLTQFERLVQNHQDKRAISKKLADQTDEDGVFQGTLDQVDISRLAKLKLRAR